MAIIYTYPRKSNPNADDLLLISDKNDRNITKTISISSIQSLVSGVFGTGTAGKLASWSSSNMIEDYPYQLAPMLSFSDTINNATYTMLAYVNGARYGSVIKMTITGTASSTVVSGSFDIMVNHSQDIHIKSLSGDYSEITLRITSNNNEDYSIEAKTNSSLPAPVTVDVSIFPLSNEIVTRTTTLPPYTGQVYEHTATEGWRYGGTDGGIESSQVVIDGKLGVGLDSPSQPLSTPAGELQVAGINPNIYFTSNDTGQSDLYFGGVTNPTKGNIKYSDNADSFFFSVNTSSVALMLSSAGNVGIGTNSPDAKLEVIGNYKQKALDGNIGGFTISINSSTDAVDLNNYYSAPLTFSTNNAERMRVASNGNVGIGSTNPSNNLTVGTIGTETNIACASTGFDSLRLGALTFPAAAGWYRIASYSTGSARGGARIDICVTGGNFAPTTYSIDYFKSYQQTGTEHTLKLEQYGGQALINKARIAVDGTSTFVEVYKIATTAGTPPAPVVMGSQVHFNRLIGESGGSLPMLGTATSGSSSTSLKEVSFIPKGTSVESLRVEGGNLNLKNLPTSASGLSTGDIWNNSGVLNIAP